MNACGTSLTNNGTHLVYANAVQGAIGKANSVISRVRCIRVS